MTSAASTSPSPAPQRKLVSPAPLARLLPRVRPHLGKVAIATICLLLASAAGLAFPLIVRTLLDAAFIDKDGGQLNRIGVGLFILFALQASLNVVQVYLLTSTAERIIAKLRTDVFAHLIRLSPGFFAERRTGELVSRLATDITVLQTVFSTNLSEFSRQTLFLLGGVTMLTITHPILAATTLAVSPVVVGASLLFGRMLRRASTGVQDKVAESSGTADEAFAQIRTVQSFTAENKEIRQYDNLISYVVGAALKRAKMRGLFFGVVTFCGFGGIVAVIWQGGRLVLSGDLTAGALVSFLLYAMYVAGAIGSLAGLFGQYQEAVGATKRIFDLLDTQPTVQEPEQPVSLKVPARGDVAFENVTFRYGNHLPVVLEDVSFRIAPGDVVALVGPSGAGKTTIASLLPRFWDVTSGRITLDDVDVRELSFQDLRGSIGIVPQEPTLFSGSVRSNIAYALGGQEVSDAAIETAAKAAHAHEFIVRLPNGYDTQVGERGVKLSGGQRQRLAIARVFLKNPALVILDEATSSLDSESERLVEAAMEDLLKNRSTLIIAHRLSTVLRADRVVVLDHGRVIEEGTHGELLGMSGMYAKLYRGQFRNEDLEFIGR